MNQEELTKTETTPAATEEAEYLTLEEAVLFLGTSKPTLYRWLATEEIKGYKAGKKWRFRKADLIAYLQRQPVMPVVSKEDLSRETAWFQEELRRLNAPLSKAPEATGLETEEIGPLVRLLMTLAIHSAASDIHLEPVKQSDESYLRLRLRVDGVLYDTHRMPFRLQEALLLGFKQLARCDLNERRPQTGRILLNENGQDFELRLSFLPTIHGEEMVARILHKGTRLAGLDNLGLVPEDVVTLQKLMQQPNGLILVAGPAGSGKTTLLYSLLEQCVGEHTKVVTIEDPIEFSLPYSTQVALGGWAGSNYALGLRMVMRHDPDVILMGDLNDRAAAALACEAALTGHLVLAALNVPGAATTVQRLIDFGIEPFLVAATLIGSVSTRLLRKICLNCKTTYETNMCDLRRYGFEAEDEGETVTLARGSGCEQCRRTGYRGRTGLFEVLTVNGEVRAVIEQGEPPEVIAAIAQASGLRTAREEGMRKVLAHETTPEEVMRVIYGQ